MFIKSFTAALIVLAGTINVSQAGTIKDTEEQNLNAKCTIISETRMECQEHCTVYNRDTGAQISQGTEGEFWNCDNTNKMQSFQAGYNDKPENQDKPASDCKAKPGQDHKGDCKITSNQPEFIPLSLPGARDHIKFMGGRNCSGSSGHYHSCYMENYYAEIRVVGNDIYVEFVTYDYDYAGWEGSPQNNTYGPFPWISSPTNANVRNEFTLTGIDNTDSETDFSIRNNGNTFEIDGPIGGPYPSDSTFSGSFGFKACRNSEPTDCATYTMGYDYRQSPW
jgi:hypothetical protein